MQLPHWLGFDAQLCLMEANIAIAANCQSQDIVLSQVSDFLAYDMVKTLWHPVGRWNATKVLEYNKGEVLTKTALTSSKLTALACVSCNDYNKNILTLGIATNYNVIKFLPDGGKRPITSLLKLTLFIVGMALIIIPFCACNRCAHDHGKLPE